MNKKILSNILRAVYDSPLGLTIEDIVSSTGHHRVTVQKYVSILADNGLVTIKRLGHYVLIFPSNMIRHIELDFTSLLIDSFIVALKKNFNLDIDALYRVGINVGKEISHLIARDIADYFKRIKALREFSNIFIPITTAKFKIKVGNFSLNDKLIIIEMNYYKRSTVDINSFCSFMRGYLGGILGSIISIRRVDILDMHATDDEYYCKFIVILDKTVSEAIMELAGYQNKQ